MVLYLVALFIIVEATIIYFGNKNLKKSENEMLQRNTKLLESAYKSVKFANKNISSLIFNEIVNKKEVIDIYKNAYKADEKERENIRKALHEKLLPTYQRLTKLNLRQLHFHLPNNVSFLRFHKPEKYGDDLTDVRYSIKTTNEKLIYQEGFEEGRIYNGFRHVFPMFDEEGAHIGSVEASLSFKALKEDIEHTYSSESTSFIVNFMVRKDIVQKKVWEFEKYYTQSDISEDYLYENIDPGDDTGKQKNISQLNKLIYKKVAQNIKDKKKFAVSQVIGEDYYIVCFLPVANVKGEKATSYLISYAPPKPLKLLYQNNALIKTIFSLFNFASMIALFILTKNYTHTRNQAKELGRLNISLLDKIKQAENLLNFTQKIIDQQENILLIFDEDINIINANRKFLDTFHMNNLHDFKKRFHNINDLILKVESEDSRYIKQIDKQVMEKLIKEHDEKHILSLMEAGEIQPMAYVANAVEIFDEQQKKRFILTLTDITMIETERKTLEKKVSIDNLTKIYNRYKLDDLIENEFENYLRSVGDLSVILFDIDHFKKINDTYGHETGDIVLKELTKIVKSSLRHNDIIIRWGGEEFLVLLPGTKIQNAADIAEKFRKLIEAHQFADINKVTCSFGATEAKENDSKNILISRADEALYRAKESGRNKVEIS